MGFVSVQCSGCGRTLQLTAERAASRPKCMYCGASVTVAAEHTESVARAAARLSSAPPAARKGKVGLDCPVCARRNLFDAARAGEQGACPYCACPFTIVEAGSSVRPGPSGVAPTSNDFRAPAVDVSGLASAIGLDRAPAIAPDAGARELLVRSALRALYERVASGVCSHDEAVRTARRVWMASEARPSSAGPWKCPLEPLAAAELVLRVIAPGMEGTSNDREIDGTTVRLVTGSHWETSTTGGASAGGILVGSAVQAALGASTGTSFGAKVQQIEIKHLLCLQFHRRPEGVYLTYHAEDARGRARDVDAKQSEWVARVRAELTRHALPFETLRAVFGEWFSATQRLALQPASLDTALARIGGEVHANAARIAAALARGS